MKYGPIGPKDSLGIGCLGTHEQVDSNVLSHNICAEILSEDIVVGGNPWKTMKT
ncbi:hypothetical protein [Maridesulfovibrio zosterae]|uniref:hypothetical protein n=1 Tax=Maridesulfovibrio zosterae TaxID=82171 RepID=UPI0004289FFB|nr:hypothetical protein [Maridesulfovibrio zosterae]